MDRMLLSALALWFIVISLLGIGKVIGTSEAAPDDSRAAAFFPHDRHMEVVDDCKSCHHRYADGVNVIEEDELDGGDAMRCRTCHNDETAIDGREAFHRQCIRCHRSLEKKGSPSGPRTCGTCHPKTVSGDLAALIIQR
jgi:hypothetical protein